VVTEDQTEVVTFLESAVTHGGTPVARIDTHASIVFVVDASGPTDRVLAAAQAALAPVARCCAAQGANCETIGARARL